MNTDMSRAPMLTVSVGRSGLNSHGSPRWLASKRTTIVLSLTAYRRGLRFADPHGGAAKTRDLTEDAIERNRRETHTDHATAMLPASNPTLRLDRFARA
jgi:hypothetical protein